MENYTIEYQGVTKRFEMMKPLRYNMGMFHGTLHEYKPDRQWCAELLLSCEIYRAVRDHHAKKFQFSRTKNGTNEVYFFKFHELFGKGFRFGTMLKNVGIVRAIDTYEVR